MGGFGSTLGLLFEINADPEHAITAMKLFQEQIAGSLGVSTKSLQQFQNASVAAAKDLAMIGAGVVAGAAGFLALAEHAAEAGAKIFDAHEKTGLTAESLSGLSAISRTTGENFDSLTQALARAGRNLTVAINEPGAMTGKVLAAVMGSAKNLEALGLKPMDERIQVVLQRIFALNDVGERNMALQALLGRGWQTNVETLNLLAEQGYAPAIAKAKEFGIFFDETSAARAKEFTVGMNSLKAELSGLALAIGQQVMPYALQLLAWLHTLKTDLEVDALRARALGEALMAPATGGLSLIAMIKDLQAATKLENAATQEQTDWLVKVDADMRAATAAAKDHGTTLGNLRQAHQEDSHELEQISRLFHELNDSLITTDKIEKQYLDTLREINKVQDDHSRQILAQLNEQRAQQELTKENVKLEEEEAKWRIEGLKQLKEETALDEAARQAMHRMQENWKTLQDQAKRAREEWILDHTQLRLLSDSAINEFVPAFQAAGATMQNFKVVGSNALAGFQTAMAGSIAQAIVYERSIGAAMASALKATLAALASEALLQALKATALGFLRLAEYDYASAAMAFKSAALWGALGVGAAIAGSAIPGGGAGRAAGAGTAAGAAPGGSSIAAKAPAERQGPQVTIVIEGNVLNTRETQQSLVDIITDAVVNRGMVLPSTYTTRQPTRLG